MLRSKWINGNGKLETEMDHVSWGKNVKMCQRKINHRSSNMDPGYWSMENGLVECQTDTEELVVFTLLTNFFICITWQKS